MADTTKSKSFSAVLTRGGDRLNWVVIYLPFDSAKFWGVRGTFRVKGDIQGFEFRTSLFPTGDGRHMLLVNKQMQKGAGVQAGMKAKFRLEPDLEERTTAIPSELERVLRTSKRLKKFFDSLHASFRNFVSASVAQGKQKETRARRAEQTGEMLLEVMEAEIDLPPILRQAFARNPEAAAAWQSMSASHRRRHLLGIFYYRSLDARLRRIERAISDMTGAPLHEGDEEEIGL